MAGLKVETQILAPEIAAPRLEVIVKDRTDPREKSINGFLAGLTAIGSVAERAIAGLSKPDIYANARAKQKVIELTTTLRNLGTIICLQSPDTKKDVPLTNTQEAQQYIATLTQQDEKPPLDLLTQEGANRAADILLQHLEKFEVYDQDTKVQSIEMSAIDVATRAILYGIICHDLNGPLAGIKGVIDYQVLRRAKNGPMSSKWPENLGMYWRILSKKVEDMLELMQDPYPQNIQPSQVWVSIVNDAAAPWIKNDEKEKDENSVTIKVVNIGKGLFSWSDPWVRSFATNCLQNASRAGAIEVDVTVGETNRGFFIEFKDYGHGFDEERLSKGFDGGHGYKSEESNEVSTGTAMRVQSQMVKAYRGELSFGNWYGDDNKIHGFVRLELPFAEETLEELAQETLAELAE